MGKRSKSPAREEADRRRRDVGTSAFSGTDIAGAEEGPALGTGGAGALGTDGTGAEQGPALGADAGAEQCLALGAASHAPRTLARHCTDASVPESTHTAFNDLSGTEDSSSDQVTDEAEPVVEPEDQPAVGIVCCAFSDFWQFLSGNFGLMSGNFELLSGNIVFTPTKNS